MTVVPLDTGRCLDCGSELEREIQDQPAIVRGCDYGATLRHEWDVCPWCGWHRLVAVSEMRPTTT